MSASNDDVMAAAESFALELEALCHGRAEQPAIASGSAEQPAITPIPTTLSLQPSSASKILPPSPPPISHHQFPGPRPPPPPLRPSDNTAVSFGLGRLVEAFVGPTDRATTAVPAAEPNTALGEAQAGASAALAEVLLHVEEDRAAASSASSWLHAGTWSSAIDTDGSAAQPAPTIATYMVSGTAAQPPVQSPAHKLAFYNVGWQSGSKQKRSTIVLG